MHGDEIVDVVAAPGWLECYETRPSDIWRCDCGHEWRWIVAYVPVDSLLAGPGTSVFYAWLYAVEVLRCPTCESTKITMRHFVARNRAKLEMVWPWSP